MAINSITQFPVVSDRFFPRDAQDLEQHLSVMVRVASALRNRRVRNEDQILVLENEIDQIRKRLGYPEVL
jgi:hypothetical protein